MMTEHDFDFHFGLDSCCVCGADSVRCLDFAMPAEQSAIQICTSCIKAISTAAEEHEKAWLLT